MNIIYRLVAISMCSSLLLGCLATDSDIAELNNQVTALEQATERNAAIYNFICSGPLMGAC